MNISERIAELPGLSKSKLALAWKELYGRAMLTHLRKELIVQLLAYRILPVAVCDKQLHPCQAVRAEIDP